MFVYLSCTTYVNIYCFLFVFVDGFSRFRATYPEWCDSCSELLLEPPGLPAAPLANQEQLPLMGLRSLRISTSQTHGHRGHLSYDSLSSAANSSTDSSDTDDRCDSSLGTCLIHTCISMILHYNFVLYLLQHSYNVHIIIYKKIIQVFQNYI